MRIAKSDHGAFFWCLLADSRVTTVSASESYTLVGARAHVVNTGVHDAALDDGPRGALKGEKRLMAETCQEAGREGSE